MNEERDISTQLLRYLDNEMSTVEKKEFELRLRNDETLREQLDQISTLKLQLGAMGEEDALRERMESIHSKVEGGSTGGTRWLIPVAASVLIIIGVGFVFNLMNTKEHDEIAEVQEEGEAKGAKMEEADLEKAVAPINFNESTMYGVMIGDQGLIITPSSPNRYSRAIIDGKDTTKVAYSKRVGGFDLYDSKLSAGGVIGRAIGTSLYTLDIVDNRQVELNIIEDGDLIELEHLESLSTARGMPIFNKADKVVAVVEGMGESTSLYANPLFSLTEQFISLKGNGIVGQSKTCKMVK